MSTLSTESWKKSFRSLFNQAVDKYRSGQRGADTFFSASQIEELAAFGYKPQELYDFAEDRVKYGEPDLELALAIAAVRRDYFFQVQQGKLSGNVIAMSSLAGKDQSVEGIVWLPRIIGKAKAKLRGEMPPDLMYSCSGDRKFFKDNNVGPVEFLRAVWKADGNDGIVIEFVKEQRASKL
jgi:hypothetical protein